MSARAFVPARDLSRAFYGEVVRPLPAGRPHAAALLGWGSDVLGYDTARSTDHGWGPRLLVFAADRDVADEVRAALDRGLPETFRGWPVRFGWDAVPEAHWVSVTTLPAWLEEFLGVDATAAPRPYHRRPARVLLADQFADALLDTVADPALRALPPIGAVDQVVDSTDVLESPEQFRRLQVLYPRIHPRRVIAGSPVGPGP